MSRESLAGKDGAMSETKPDDGRTQEEACQRCGQLWCPSLMGGACRLDDPALNDAASVPVPRALLERIVEAMAKAGEWIAVVEPKLPMPGDGDTQTPLLAEVCSALDDLRKALARG